MCGPIALSVVPDVFEMDPFPSVSSLRIMPQSHVNHTSAKPSALTRKDTRGFAVFPMLTLVTHGRKAMGVYGLIMISESQKISIRRKSAVTLM